MTCCGRPHKTNPDICGGPQPPLDLVVRWSDHGTWELSCSPAKCVSRGLMRFSDRPVDFFGWPGSREGADALTRTVQWRGARRVAEGVVAAAPGDSAPPRARGLARRAEGLLAILNDCGPRLQIARLLLLSFLDLLAVVLQHPKALIVGHVKDAAAAVGQEAGHVFDGLQRLSVLGVAHVQNVHRLGGARNAPDGGLQGWVGNLGYLLAPGLDLGRGRIIGVGRCLAIHKAGELRLGDLDDDVALLRSLLDV